MRRLAFAIGALVTVAVLFVAVFPTRALLDQRRARNDTLVQLRALERQNQALDDQAQRLRSDPEIERLAREHYNLVRPGEEAYAMLPSHADQTPATAQAAVKKPPRRAPTTWWSRLWSKVTGVF